MATSLNTPLTGEIWHLSIEDLLQPLQEAPRLGGSGPFVINLSASSAPIAPPAKQLAEFTATAHVYQIQRTEDRRPRYRLRLGPFLTEDEADALLAKVREIYPSALTATAESDDLRAIASLQAKAEALATGRHAKRAAATSPAAASAPILRAVPAKETTAVSSSDAATANAPATVNAPASAGAPGLSAPRAAASVPTSHKPPAAAPQAAVAPAAAVAPVAPVAEFRAAAAPVPQAQPIAPPAAIPTPQAAVPAAHAAPAHQAKPSPQPQAAPSRARQIPRPLAIPVLSDTVSLARRPPVRATARRAVPPKAHAPRPVPTITHKVIPTITHKLVPTITEEVELAPAPLKFGTAQGKTASEAVAPLPVKPVTEAVPAPAALKVHAIPAAALKAEPATPAPAAIKPMPAPAPVAPAAAGIRPTPAPVAQAAPAFAQSGVVKPPPETAAPAVVKAAPAAPGAAPIKAVAASPASTPVKPAAPAVKPACAAPVAVKPMPHQAMPAALNALLAPSARRVEALNEPLPNLESTQTLRPLTQLELEDDTISRWFVIQLSLAEEGFDPDSLPNLDIFGEYRLYSVAGIDQGKVMHALRLGFFAEEGAAAAVASYLSAFYEKPTIKRISTAERDRFSDQRVEARMDVGATGRHAVIEITSERVVREKRTTATVMPMPVRPAGVAGGGAPR